DIGQDCEGWGDKSEHNSRCGLREWKYNPIDGLQDTS
ncbi:unnamed protein product, partial [Allacma fusca]